MRCAQNDAIIAANASAVTTRTIGCATGDPPYGIMMLMTVWGFVGTATTGKMIFGGLAADLGMDPTKAYGWFIMQLVLAILSLLTLADAAVVGNQWLLNIIIWAWAALSVVRMLLWKPENPKAAPAAEPAAEAKEAEAEPEEQA